MISGIVDSERNIEEIVMASSKYTFTLLAALILLLGLCTSVMSEPDVGVTGVGHIIDAGCREGYVKINGVCVEDLWVFHFKLFREYKNFSNFKVFQTSALFGVCIRLLSSLMGKIQPAVSDL